MIIVIIVAASLNAQARFFLNPLEKFIIDGKQYTLILEEGLKRINISSEKDMILYDESGERLELKKGFDYIIRLAADRPVYELQILATTNRDRAENLQEELFQKGYRNVIILEEEGWLKVRLSGFTEKKLVDEVRESLEKEGFDIWLISRIIETSPELIIYDPLGEELLSGKEFSISGEVIINGEKYPGKSRFVMAGKGFSILNNVELNDLLSALMLAMEREDYYFTNDHEEFLKARAVSMRTALLYLVVERSIFKQGYYFSLPEYHGTAEVSENIRKAISDTEGLVLGRNELIAELDLRDLLTGGFAIDVIEKGILQNLSFDRILEEQYPGIFLKDL
ncbi:MAG TPA: SPOR domain-containing protein, partial [Halanaerobiales bacterium]|nr:SPOR domain-containing protein [Halanaerobiales bacterium]